jgi:hypothetical protein
MLNPEKNPSSWVEDPEYDYTCPEYTRGSHYRGATRVSLIDATSGSIINTVEVKDEDLKGEDSFDVPYAIKKGYAYKVEGAPKRGAEAKPILLALEDYNRDGKAHEFVLAVAQACMGLNTTLIGYSARQDKVVQYPIELELGEDGKTTKETSLWFDYLFSYEMPGASVYKSEKAPKGGRWKFENDYRGRGGALYEYDLRYDKETEIFKGSRNTGDCRRLTPGAGSPRRSLWDGNGTAVQLTDRRACGSADGPAAQSSSYCVRPANARERATGAVDLNGATALEGMRVFEQAVRRFGEMDASGQAVRFHTAGDIDGVAPKIVAEFVGR